MPTIDHSSVIEADTDRVWQVLRRFGDIPLWFSAAITTSVIEDGLPQTAVGCVRVMQLSNGNSLRERLFSLDDQNRVITYGLDDDTLPYDDFVMRVEVLPVSGHDRSFLRWTARYVPRPGSDVKQGIEALRALITGGDASLHAYFAEGRDR